MKKLTIPCIFIITITACTSRPSTLSHIDTTNVKWIFNSKLSTCLNAKTENEQINSKNDLNLILSKSPSQKDYNIADTLTNWKHINSTTRDYKINNYYRIRQIEQEDTIPHLIRNYNILKCYNNDKEIWSIEIIGFRYLLFPKNSDNIIYYIDYAGTFWGIDIATGKIKYYSHIKYGYGEVIFFVPRKYNNLILLSGKMSVIDENKYKDYKYHHITLKYYILDLNKK